MPEQGWRCPSCSAVLDAPAPRCPECRLTLQKLDLKFGLVPAHSRFLSDRSGTLPLDGMNRLREELRLFQKKFPQSLFSVLITELPRGTSISEYAFWFANRAKFGSAHNKGANNFNILLVFDVATEAAALTVGYGLEPYVSEEDLQQALDIFASEMRDADIISGLQACIDFMTRRLRELSAKARNVQLAPTPA